MNQMYISRKRSSLLNDRLSWIAYISLFTSIISLKSSCDMGNWVLHSDQGLDSHMAEKIIA